MQLHIVELPFHTVQHSLISVETRRTTEYRGFHRRPQNITTNEAVQIIAQFLLLWQAPPGVCISKRRH